MKWQEDYTGNGLFEMIWERKDDGDDLNDEDNLSNNLSKLFSAMPFKSTSPFRESFISQMFPRNSTDKLLSYVSLEMLNKFLVMGGTSRISFSAMCGCICLIVELLKVKRCITSMSYSKPCPFLMIRWYSPLNYSLICILAMLFVKDELLHCEDTTHHQQAFKVSKISSSSCRECFRWLERQGIHIR